MLIDIRAREITELRQKTRELTATLAELEANGRVNDNILLALHRLSLLLIRKPAGWQARAVALLKKSFSFAHCELLPASAVSAAPLAPALKRLPAGGKAFSEPLKGARRYAGAKRYFYLPLKKGATLRGVLVFTSKKADAFPDSAARDFTRRLAELLAAAL